MRIELLGVLILLAVRGVADAIDRVWPDDLGAGREDVDDD